MANKEQLVILKQGVTAWNGWRAKNIYVYADLNEADLHGGDLSGADLRIAHLKRANLFRANLSGADLSGADLSDADLREANLQGANLTKANLNGANLSHAFVKEADLRQANLLAANLRNANFGQANLADANLMVAHLGGADLRATNLGKANFTKAQLSGVNLRRADLSEAKLNGANFTQSNLLEARFIESDLNGTIFSEAMLGNTVFANADLSKVKGLESAHHFGPSQISMDTIPLSLGKIPDVFLRGCGLSDADVEYAKLSSPDLDMEEIHKILQKVRDLRATHALQVSPLFISYSAANNQFVDKLGIKLTQKGIRYWRDMHEKKSGQMEKQIAQVIRHNAKILLVLSEQSIKSDWMERELQDTGKLEKETGRLVVFPVALDDRWKSNHLPKNLTEQLSSYSILDISDWKDNNKFDGLFSKVMDGLGLFYKA